MQENWMRREIERVGRALFTGTKTGYVGTEEDLHHIGQTVEGVCETNLRLMNVEALNAELVEALEETTDWIVQFGQSRHFSADVTACTHCRVIRQGTQALAKARGES